MAGKIHLSQATADELVKAGKEHWFVPREDKVYAKGKGKFEILSIASGYTRIFLCISDKITFESQVRCKPTGCSLTEVDPPLVRQKQSSTKKR